MRTLFATAFVVFAVFAPHELAARQAGTAVLAGTLMTEGPAPQPVKRAVVRLAGASGTSSRLVGTDDQGRFVFGALPAGEFTISATKTGYVPAFYGSKRPGRGPGAPIAIASAQRVTVTLKILPGAVITGTITDPRGNPVPSVPVMAMEIRPAGVAASAPARATTDDRGVYRLFGLMPGDYVVSASPRFAAGINGTAVEIFGVTDAEVQWARGLGASTVGSGAAIAPATRAVAYAPVYYPGTTNVGAAEKVSVAMGEERADVGFQVAAVPIARISGTLVDQTGQPLNATTSMALYPRLANQSSTTDALIASATPGLWRLSVNVPSFWIWGVAPGDYTLVARTGSPGKPEAGVASAQWSVTDLTVDGRDQPDLILRLERGVRISGSTVFERTSQTPPADLTRLDITLVPPNARIVGPVAPQATVDPAGRFVFPSVVQGSYSLKAKPVAGANATWILKSAMLNDRDLADVPLDLRSGQDVTGVVVTFTERGSEIAGKALDAAGQPVTRYSIVVFTVDQSLWLPGARRIRSTNPSADGAFSVAGLPAGEYAIAAAEGVESSDLADPVFLAQLLASAHRVTLAEGEKKLQDLRIGRFEKP